jgi:hypothetical protein
MADRLVHPRPQQFDDSGLPRRAPRIAWAERVNSEVHEGRSDLTKGRGIEELTFADLRKASRTIRTAISSGTFTSAGLQQAGRVADQRLRGLHRRRGSAERVDGNRSGRAVRPGRGLHVPGCESNPTPVARPRREPAGSWARTPPEATRCG